MLYSIQFKLNDYRCCNYILYLLFLCICSVFCLVFVYSIAPFEDVPKKNAATYFLESIPSGFGRKPERLQSSRVIEYIPSSNPDSPPPSFLSDSYFDLEEEIVRDVCDYLSRHEVDITKYDSPYNPNAGKFYF